MASILLFFFINPFSKRLFLTKRLTLNIDSAASTGNHGNAWNILASLGHWWWQRTHTYTFYVRYSLYVDSYLQTWRRSETLKLWLYLRYLTHTKSLLEKERASQWHCTSLDCALPSSGCGAVVAYIVALLTEFIIKLGTYVLHSFH
jgi:hypothetical protein